MAVLSGILTKFLNLARNRFGGTWFALSGTVKRGFALVRTAPSGTWKPFLGALIRVIALTRTPSATWYALTGVLSSRVSKRVLSGVWQGFAGVVSGVKPSGISGSANAVWYALTGAVSRVFTLTRVPSGTWFAFIGTVTRFLGIPRGISGIWFALTGSVVRKLAGARVVSATVYILSGAVTRILTKLQKSASAQWYGLSGIAAGLKMGGPTYYAVSVSGSFSMGGSYSRNIYVSKSVLGGLRFKKRYCDGYKDIMPYGVKIK